MRKRKMFIAFGYTCHESRYIYIQVILDIMLFLTELSWDEATKTSTNMQAKIPTGWNTN